MSPTETLDRKRIEELERSLRERQSQRGLDRTRSAAPASPALPYETDPDDSETVFAVMGGTERTGRWEPAGRINVYALMGGVKLDFRDADLLEGTTEVRAYTMWGGIEIIVPPDVNVEVNGIGLMGGFTHLAHRAADDHAPTIRVRGLALMAGVNVKVRDFKKKRRIK